MYGFIAIVWIYCQCLGSLRRVVMYIGWGVGVVGWSVGEGVPISTFIQ